MPPNQSQQGATKSQLIKNKEPRKWMAQRFNSRIFALMPHVITHYNKCRIYDQGLSLHLVVESHSNLSIFSISSFLGDFPKFSFNPCSPYEVLRTSSIQCNFHMMKVYKCSTLSLYLQVIVLNQLVLYQFQ